MVIIFLLSFTVGLAGAWFMAQYGFKLRLVDYPVPRSSHSVPVPKSGGIGMLVAFIVAGWLAHAPASLLIPAGALSLVGFLGDKTHISPKIRLVAQFLAALISLSGTGLEPWIVVPAAVFVVGTANFFNFMDGIDGIAGLIGVAAFCLVGAFAYSRVPLDPVGPIAFGLAAACAGFLPFNIYRAKVFMGDVGSVLLGYVFGYAVVRLSTGPADFMCLSAFLFMFYADELTTMSVRLGMRENLFAAHRRHYYQILANELRIEHWKISVGYALAQLCVGLGAWWALRCGIYFLFTFLLAAFAVFCILSSNLRRRLSGLDETGM